jgi:hypothetical protein
MLALERDRFISAVTGHHRSREAAREVVDARFAPPAAPTGGDA